jgi:glycerate kinase
MRILIAPDKFKDSLTADRVAEAMVRAARFVHPDASFVIRPIADGGEGTLDAFTLGLGGRVKEIEVSGPLESSVRAPVAFVPDRQAIVESATASGLSLVAPDPRTAASAHTFGTGQLIVFASEGEVDRVTVGIGGTASTDGGTGAARAAGWRFLDEKGEEIGLGGTELSRLRHVEAPQAPLEVEVVGACDVDNVLLGDEGAARVFSPQKGADGATTDRLAEGLERLAQVVSSDLGIDVANTPHGGAGGGLGAGLVAFFGATLQPGLDLLAASTGLEAEIAASDLIITGEGRLDSASLSGKAPIAVARIAARHHKPCVAIVGDLQVDKHALKRNGIETAVGLKQTGGESLSEKDPARAIEKALESVLTHRLEKKRGRSLRR